MVVYNAASRELTAKIVYYGPGFGGKTTNLQFLHRRLEPSSVGNLLTLAATADRTIFFDLLPVELGDLKGYRIRFQVATVPGQSPYNETRRVVLRGADGVVFVVDSRWSQLPKNLESLQNLRRNLEEEGIDPAAIPLAVQFNKRDLPDVLAVDALQEGLGLAAFPFIEAVASEGKGVVETFKLISKLTFVDILRRLQKRGLPKPARTAPTETESLSAWKTSMVHGSSPLAPEPAPARPAGPEPIAFEPEDMGTTRAIPTLVQSRPAPAAAEAPAPPAVVAAPFPVDDELPETEPDSGADARADAVVFETFPPIPEPERGFKEDTNPAFFERRPPPAQADPGQSERATTAGFALDDLPAQAPARAGNTTPMPLAFEEAPGVAPQPDEDAAPAAGIPDAADIPVPAAPPPRPFGAPPEAAREAPVAASPLEERMIQLAVVSAWGDRISAAEEKLAGWGAIDERLAAVERGLTAAGEMPGRVAAFESRLGALEGARAWAKDVDLLRIDWTNARLAAETQMGELRRGLTETRQTIAEASGREMELVAQVSRESLTAAAALEKLGFRIQETEEKFSQLVIDQESRLVRLERLVDEQNTRATADRDAARQSLLELEERFRALREGEAEGRRRMETSLEDGLRRLREEIERRQSSADELRDLLAEAIGDLVARLRPPRPS